MSLQSLQEARARHSASSTSKPKAFTEYRGRPNEFFRDVLGVLPVPYQRKLNRLFVENQRTAVRSCTGSGKTWDLARLSLYELCTEQDRIVLTTATTWAQVKNQLWRELRNAHAESRKPLPGSPMSTELSLDEKWFAMGISTRRPESMAGFHARAEIDLEDVFPEGFDDGFEVDADFLKWWGKQRRHSAGVTVIADEASGIEDDLLEAADGLLTNPDSRLLLSGNPLRIQGRFFEVFHPPPGKDSTYATMTIAAEDVPAKIMDPAWIKYMRELCGPDPEKHPHFQARVMGIHPTSAENCLFPLHLIESTAAIQPPKGGRHIGVDIARQGGDQCVAVLLIDGRVRAVDAWTYADGLGGELVRTAFRIKKLMEGWKVKPGNVHVDVTGGWGWGPVDRLWEMGLIVDGVTFSESPKEDWRHELGRMLPVRTRRQELHQVAAQLMRDGKLAIPSDARYGPLIRDLADIRFAHKGDGLFWVESKEEYRSRTKRSPDYSDALLCALSRTDASQVRFTRIRSRRRRA